MAGTDGRAGLDEPARDMISERHLSPALRSLSGSALRLAPLTGIRVRIYSRLWQTIADGRMKAGAALVEGDLVAVFGVSRTIIRSVLERLAVEGCVVIEPNKGARVATPSPAEAQAVFETIAISMGHIVRELADPLREITAGQRALLAMHIEAQAQADAAGEPTVAHLLAVEYLLLLAAIHGSTLLADLLSRALVLETLSLKLYGRFPLPPSYAEFQQSLTDVILAHRQEEALDIFNARLGYIRGTLRPDAAQTFEEEDLAKLLGGAR